MSNNTETSVANGLLGQCLICNKQGTEEQPNRRGLCAAHYEQFRRAKEILPENKKDQFEQDMIAAGNILPPQKGGRATVNPFAEAAQKYLSPNDQKFLAETAKAAQKLDQKAKKAKKKKPE